MEYSIQNLSKSKIEIALNVAKDEWEKDIKSAYEKNKYKYAVDGFRKGKVPFNVIVNRYGMEALYEDTIDYTLSRCYSEIIKSDNLEIVGDPDVDLKEVSDEGVKAVITVAVKPEFTLGQYKGLTFTKPSTEVTEEEIKAVIDRELNARARMIEKEEGAVETGDTVIIDYSGSVDGVKFDGGTAESQSLEIGSGAFIPGFEEQLVGMKIGEEKDINVKFPDQYTEELAGKDAVFHIVLHGIQSKEVPELNDDFVKDIDDELDTVEQWKEKIKAELTAKKTEEAEYKLENDIIDQIAANTEIDIPECMVEEELDYRIKELEQGMKQYGLKFEDYLAYTGTTVEQIKDERREEAYKNIKSRLIIEAILKQEKIEVTPEELNAEFEKLDDSQKNAQGMNYLANKLVIDKLFAFLKENNKIN